MDIITLTINSINIPALTVVAALLDNDVFYASLVLLLTFFTEKRWNKRWKIVAALVIVVALCSASKLILAIDRPCATGLPSKIPCHYDYSFPSTHTAVAFVLMIAFLGKDIFPLYFLFAIFVAFTRIYLGVHSFVDIAGALALAPIAYDLADNFMRSDDEKGG